MSEHTEVSYRENLDLLAAIEKTIDQLTVCMKNLDTAEMIRVEKEMFPHLGLDLAYSISNTNEYIRVLKKLLDCCSNVRPPRSQFDIFMLMMKEGEVTIPILERRYLRIKQFSDKQKIIALREQTETKTENV
jgi:hypothetical protein